MRSLLGKKLADSVSSVGSMILFLLFAACSLIMIAAGASTYARISASFDDTFGSSAAARYVTNKIRSGDSAVIGLDGRAVSVYSGDTVCVISTGSEGVTERVMRAEDTVDYSKGDVIFPGTSLYLTDEGEGLYSMTISSGKSEIKVSCRSKG